MIACVDPAHNSGSVVVNVISEGNEEDAVVRFLHAQLETESRGPLGRLIGPVTCPFLVAPGITQLEELNWLTVTVLDFVYCYHRVCMVAY